jgi:hypothetical protein
MKTLIILINTVLFSLSLQAQQFNWGLSIGDSAANNANSLVDKHGNVYSAGNFFSSIDFDPSAIVFNMASQGQGDVFLQKLNSNGQLIWAKSFGNQNMDECIRISLDHESNFYLLGSFQGTVDFDSGPGIATLSSISGLVPDRYVAKFDSNGNFVWVKNIGFSLPLFPLSIHSDCDKNILITGAFEMPMDFDPGPNTLTVNPVLGFDIFVLKLDSLGNFLWVKTFGSTKYEFGNSVNTDKSGNIYCTGSFRGTIDFNPGTSVHNLSPHSTEDIFILKLNKHGDFVWAKNMGGSYASSGYQTVIDDNGNVLVCGAFQDTIDFDPGPLNYTAVSNGLSDIFITKMDSFGNFIWANTVGGFGSDAGWAITTDGTGNVYCTGSFTDSVDFNSGSSINYLSSLGHQDQFVLKLDATGNYQWAVNFKSSLLGYGSSISIDALGGLVVAGVFDSTADLNPGSGTYNVATNGNTDYLIVKLNAYPTAIQNTPSLNFAIWLYPNPSNGKLTAEISKDLLNSKFTVSDIAGRIIYESVLRELKSEFNFNNLTYHGTYLITVHTGNLKLTDKIWICN